MRVGPSRLISTAESSGESNDTVAAEWMTMSQLARTSRSASARPRPSVPTSPATVVMRAPGPVVEGGAVLGAQAVEGVVLEQLALDAAGRRRALAVAHQQDELAPGHAAQQPFDQRRADEPRRPGDGDPFAGERLGDHAHMSSTSLPTGREPPPADAHLGA